MKIGVFALVAMVMLAQLVSANQDDSYAAYSYEDDRRNLRSRSSGRSRSSWGSSYSSRSYSYSLLSYGSYYNYGYGLGAYGTYYGSSNSYKYRDNRCNKQYQASILNGYYTNDGQTIAALAPATYTYSQAVNEQVVK
jgi:asparagine N-glycosylation enzyme membrane subunit Stt3